MEVYEHGRRVGRADQAEQVAQAREEDYEVVMKEAERIKDLLPDDKPNAVTALVGVAAALRARRDEG